VLRDYEDGLVILPSGYTVKDAIGEWLPDPSFGPLFVMQFKIPGRHAERQLPGDGLAV
jgi:hypothetical protein